MIPAPVALVSGSGIDLLPLLDAHEEKVCFSQAGLPHSSVVGHQSCFYFGKSAEIPIILQAGRIHLYEGLRADEVARPVEWLHERGVRTLILTNAVGGLAPTLRRGAVVGAESVLIWPCMRARLPETMRSSLVVPHCDATGTYVWMHGPCYETPAEIGALRRMGGLTVGMSCALELARATELGMRCAIVSCVTNVCGVPGCLKHEDVLQQARASSERMCGLLRDYLTSA